MDTCFPPESSWENDRWWCALERAESSDPRAADAWATRKAVLYVSNSNGIYLSDPLDVKGGLKKDIRTTLNFHFGRTCSVRGL